MKKNKKVAWQQYIVVFFFMLIGATCGLLMGEYMGSLFASEKLLWQKVLSVAIMVAEIYFVFFLQIFIHEAGHLVFGRLTGYQFSSFRIMSFMWIKENEKIEFRRLTVTGTGGQCLMVPPQMEGEKFPVVLYNLGGSLMNVFAGIVFLGNYFVFSDIPFLSPMFLMATIIGFGFAIINGVPLHMGVIDNDGYNAFALSKNKEALRAFWLQLKINEKLAKGIRMKNMPEEWFVVPCDEAMKNSMICTMGISVCNYLMDCHRFDEADKLMNHLLKIDSGMVGVHRSLLICDRIYCELIGENRENVVKEMLSKEQKKFMKSMRTFPAVIRAEFAYSLLGEQDVNKAEKYKKQFNKCARKYPYPSDIEAERELMRIAERK